MASGGWEELSLLPQLRWDPGVPEPLASAACVRGSRGGGPHRLASQLPWERGTGLTQLLACPAVPGSGGR